MDPISAIIAMVAAAGLKAYDGNRAANAQKNAALQAQQRQLASQNQASQAASRRASEFDPTQRQASQDAIRDQLTTGYDKAVAGPQVTAQGVQVGTTIPDAAGTGDYSVAKAKEQAKSAASLHALAGLMGRIGSASQLRQGEAVRIGDTAGEIGRIQTGANNIWQADQAGIEAAGRPSVFAQIASSALNAAGMAGLAGAGGAAGGSTLPTTGDFARLDRAGSWLK